MRKDTDAPHMMTLGCSNRECNLRVRIGRLLSKPAMAVGAFRYCPLCASPAMARTDNDEDYWEIISESLELPIEVTRALYDLWVPESNRVPRFSDFVAEIKEEVRIGKEKVAV